MLKEGIRKGHTEGTLKGALKTDIAKGQDHVISQRGFFFYFKNRFLCQNWKAYGKNPYKTIESRNYIVYKRRK